MQSFSWLKDGQPLRQSGRASFQTTGNVLVIRNAEKEDMGMYQCVARNSKDMAQSSAQLKLGGECCRPISTFQLTIRVEIHINSSRLSIFILFFRFQAAAHVLVH